MLAYIILFVLALLFLCGCYCMVDYDATIIWFHRPDCGFCVKMEPEWQKFRKMAPSNILLKKINIRDYPDMADDFGVEGVPFIVKVVGKKRVVYKGDRSAGDLLKFAAS